MSNNAHTLHPYWSAVVFCLATTQGYTEIHYKDGSIEAFGPLGVRVTPRQSNSVTAQPPIVTPSKRKQKTTMGEIS